MNFDWRTEEDEQQWNEEVVPKPAVPGRKRRPWLLLGLISLVVIAGVGGVYARLEQRAAAVTETIEADILIAHALVRQADERGDGELFGSLLSGSDPAWSAVQRQIFASKALVGRQFLGLAAGTEPAEAIQVTVAPDLNTAELSATHVFTTTSLNGLAQTVRLQQVSVYRQEAGRWLLAPPPAEFWGRPVVNRGPRLTLTYPERDEAIGERLAVYLEQLVSQLCAPSVELGCPADWQLQVSLETEPDALLGVVLRDGREMKLPAPSLVGVPLDEAGYITLSRAYGTALATGLILEFGGSVCCGRTAVAEALLAWQLHLLGLQPWPLRPADYQVMWQNPVSLPQLAIYWDRTPGQPVGDWRPLYALAEFLGQAVPEVSPVTLRRQVAEAASYEEWLRLFLWRDRYSDKQLDELWLDFNNRRLAAAGAVAPVNLPAEDLLLTCRAHPDSFFDLVRLNLATGLWRQELGERDFYALYGLPDGDGALLMDQIAGLGGPLLSRVSLWRDGREQTVYTGLTFYYYGGQADASGRRLVLYGVEPEDGGLSTALLDLASCEAAACVLGPASPEIMINTDGDPDVRPARMKLLAAIVDVGGNERASGVEAIGLESFTFSPDGRWLMVNVTTPTPANTTPLWRQYLYDTRIDSLSVFSFDSSFVYPEQDWSADGQWLVRLGDGFLLLSAPGHNYQQVIVHPFYDCTNVVWVAK